MAASGTVLDWTGERLDGPVVDKHSTGGVGDKVSFLLAPIAAACGCYVPMISGRGLGHTGGTTDKVESIPGYNSSPDFALFRKVVREAGCAIIGQTADLAPADRRFYAIRDVTATVESVPLITASILSKKIAAGLEALVMDVKVGSGAFMRSMEKALELAESIIATASSAGLRTHALVTDMNECLGTSAGNALEIRESIAFLADRHRDARLNEVVTALTAEMLVATGLERDRKFARERTEQALASGSAMAVFARMVSGLGGPADFVEHYDRYLPRAPVSIAVSPTRSGYLAAVDAFRLGTAIIELGGGRRRLGDELDLAVGLSDVAGIGEYVDGERPLAVVQARTEDTAAAAAAIIRQACRTRDDEPAESPVIYEYLGAE
jgi:thymidine phosphorylase